MSGHRYIIAWFNRSDWVELKRLCPPGDLQDTYDEWLANAGTMIKSMGVTDDEVEKVILTPDDLREWQTANGGKINSKVRATLAVELAIRKNTRH